MRAAGIRVALLLGIIALVGTASQGGAARSLRPMLIESAEIKHPPLRAGKTTLYDQTGNDSGTGFVSQNFEAEFDAYDCQGADDFVVPRNAKWKVTEVDILGNTGDGDGRADSENVVFYKDKRGKPGTEIARFDRVIGQQTLGSFVIDLGKSVTLEPGHYWLSMQVNESFSEQGEWSWEMSNGGAHKPSVWRNPGDGFASGCTEWTVQSDCYDFVTGDQMFALKGKDVAAR